MKKRRLRRYFMGGMGGMGGINTSALTNMNIGTPAGLQQGASPYFSSNNLNTIGSSAADVAGATQQKGSWFNSQAGQMTGLVANAAANMLPQGNTPNMTEKEKQTEEFGTKVAGAIGPWWGALAKVGTTASSHMRGNDNVSHSQGFLADQVNPFHQFNSLQEGRAREKYAAFINPVMASHLAAKRRKGIYEGKERTKVNELQKGSQDRLNAFNTTGDQYYAKYGMKFPMGGDLPEPTEYGQGEQLASNMAQYHGPKHSGGGIELDTDKDAKADIEVEGKEVIKDNMVFSNRLRPSKDAKKFARQAGVSIMKGDTYATLSARIGKKKGQYEQQVNSTRPGEKNTAQLMQGRLDEVANTLFMDQQVRKFKREGGKKYPKGGKFSVATSGTGAYGSTNLEQYPQSYIPNIMGVRKPLYSSINSNDPLEKQWKTSVANRSNALTTQIRGGDINEADSVMNATNKWQDRNIDAYMESQRGNVYTKFDWPGKRRGASVKGYPKGGKFSTAKSGPGVSEYGYFPDFRENKSKFPFSAFDVNVDSPVYSKANKKASIDKQKGMAYDNKVKAFRVLKSAENFNRYQLPGMQAAIQKADSVMGANLDLEKKLYRYNGIFDPKRTKKSNISKSRFGGYL